MGPIINGLYNKCWGQAYRLPPTIDREPMLHENGSESASKQKRDTPNSVPLFCLSHMKKIFLAFRWRGLNSRNQNRLVVSERRRARVYKGTAEENVTCFGKGGARKRADDAFYDYGIKSIGVKRTLLRRGGGRWIRFSAEKPWRLRYAAGLPLRAAFRIRLTNTHTHKKTNPMDWSFCGTCGLNECKKNENTKNDAKNY